MVTYKPYKHIINFLSTFSNKDSDKDNYCDRKVTPSDWPENSGCQKDTEEEEFKLKENEIIDRFGKNTGEYLSSPNYTFEQRSMYQVRNFKTCELKYQAWAKQNYKRFRVIKPFNVMKCKVAEAFGFIGGADQYRLYDKSIVEATTEVNGKKKVTVQDLIDYGYIEKIDNPDIPSFGEVIRSNPPSPEEKELLITKDTLSNKVNQAEKTLKEAETQKNDSQIRKAKENLKTLTKKAEQFGKQEKNIDEQFISVVMAAKQQQKEQSNEQKLPMNQTQNNDDDDDDNPREPAQKSFRTARRSLNPSLKTAGGFNKKIKKPRKSRKPKKPRKSRKSRKPRKPKKNQRTQKN